MSEMTVGSLAAADLGATISLKHEMAVVTGQVQTIEHRYSIYGSPRTFLALQAGEYRWLKHLDSDTPITIDRQEARDA